MSEKIVTIYRHLSVRNRSVLLSYGFGIGSSFLVLFIHAQYAQFLWNASPFLMFLPAVILTSWYGGFLPGIVATITATLVGDYFFFNPLYTLVIANSTDLVRLLLFSTTGILISVINQTFYNQKAEKERILLQLEASELRFKRIANSAPVMLWIVDDFLTFSFINNAFENYLGGQNSKNFLDAVHPDDKKELQKILHNAFRNHSKFQHECRLKKGKGVYHWVIISGVPNISLTGRLLGYLGTCIDIHERKQIEEQKTTFLSVIAHELRTPLATVQLINQLLINKYKSKQAKDDVYDLENMYSEIENLSLLMQELLDFIRGEQGMLPLHMTQGSVTQLLENIVQSYRQTFQAMDFEFSVKKNYIVSMDAKRLKQVFYNLLDNAVKACNKKGKIAIAIREQKDSLIMSVADDGKGIATNQQKSIFNRYYQISDYKKEGFGLGLYIAKQIVQKHHGKIWVQSKTNEGSTFSVQLPYAKVMN